MSAWIPNETQGRIRGFQIGIARGASDGTFSHPLDGLVGGTGLDCAFTPTAKYILSAEVARVSVDLQPTGNDRVNF